MPHDGYSAVCVYTCDKSKHHMPCSENINIIKVPCCENTKHQHGLPCCGRRGGRGAGGFCWFLLYITIQKYILPWDITLVKYVHYLYFFKVWFAEHNEKFISCCPNKLQLEV